MNKVTTVGIDLAKPVFGIHAVDEKGHVVLRKTVGRARMLPTLAQLRPCLLGMESCSGAHARQIEALGHRVRIRAARFVAPYRRKGKNDGNAAEAICEAVQRPAMRFVPVKSASNRRCSRRFNASATRYHC